MSFLLVTIIVLIAYGTLAPFDFHFSRPYPPWQAMVHYWPVKLERSTVRDIVLNLIVFLPLGIAASLTFVHKAPRVVAFAGAVLLGSALSFGVEALQTYEAHRIPSAMDWLCNTCGAALGAACGLLYQNRIEGALGQAKRRSAAAGILLAATFVAAQLYPFLPAITRSRIGPALRQLLASHLSWVEVLAGAAAWFTFALAVRAIWGRLPWPWLALCMTAIPVRLAISGRGPGKSDFVAAVVALGLWIVVSDPFRHGAACLLMGLAIVLRELSPFRFPGPEHGFSWMPFEASLSGEQTRSTIVVLRKLFEYGSMVWLLGAGRCVYLRAGLGLAIALLLMEAAQRWMPGRSPELTDAILALLMALALRALGEIGPAKRAK